MAGPGRSRRVPVWVADTEATRVVRGGSRVRRWCAGGRSGWSRSAGRRGGRGRASPAWVLSRWWWVQQAARLGSLVGPPSDQAVMWSSSASAARAAAPGEPAIDVAGADVVGEPGRWVVGGAAVVEQGARQRVGDQPAPHPVRGRLAGEGGGDRAVPDELGGLVVGPGQRRVRDRRPGSAACPGSPAGSAGPARSRRRCCQPASLSPPSALAVAGVARCRCRGGRCRCGVGAVASEAAVEQGGEEVRAAGIHRPRIISTQTAGQPGQPRERPRRIGRGQHRPQRAHPVRLGGDHHPPIPTGLPVSRLRPVGVGGDHRTSQRRLELGQGLLRRPRQHPGLHGAGQLRRQHPGGVVDRTRFRRVDLPGLPQRVGLGQRAQQPAGQPDPGTARCPGTGAAPPRPRPGRTRCPPPPTAPNTAPYPPDGGGPARPAAGPAARPPTTTSRSNPTIASINVSSGSRAGSAVAESRSSASHPEGSHLPKASTGSSGAASSHSGGSQSRTLSRSASASASSRSSAPSNPSSNSSAGTWQP